MRGRGKEGKGDRERRGKERKTDGGGKHYLNFLIME